MEVVAIINQKGGVGKSTTAHALGAGLHRKGKEVLFIDLDPQGNLSYALRLEQGNRALKSIYEPLVDNSPDRVQIFFQEILCGQAIASSPKLTGADNILTDVGKEYRLREVFERYGIRRWADYVIIDTPPALGILTINALTAATRVIIPTQADIFSIQGIGQLYSTIDVVKRYTNPALVVDGILLTRYSARSILTRDMTEMIEETALQLDARVYNARIREGVAIKEAQAKRQDIFSYAPTSNAAMDYAAFVEEFLEGVESDGR